MCVTEAATHSEGAARSLHAASVSDCSEYHSQELFNLVISVSNNICCSTYLPHYQIFTFKTERLGNDNKSI